MENVSERVCANTQLSSRNKKKATPSPYISNPIVLLNAVWSRVIRAAALLLHTLIFCCYKTGEYATITKEPEQVQGKKAGSVVYFAWIVLTSRPQRIEGWINTAHLKKRDLVSAPLVGNNNIPSSVQTASCIKAATSDPPKKITNIVVKV